MVSGHLETTMRISEYKKKGGKLPYGFEELGKDDWVKLFPLPDPVRGKFAHISDATERCSAYIEDFERYQSHSSNFTEK